MCPVETRYGKKTNHGRVFCIDPCFISSTAMNWCLEAVFYWYWVHLYNKLQEDFPEILVAENQGVFFMD